MSLGKINKTPKKVQMKTPDGPGAKKCFKSGPELLKTKSVSHMVRSKKLLLVNL